ncbi:MAG: metal ABC transporter permease, partial [Caldilineaceae bacterium]|nr:metal ABC transporter permease [Caldilineaceae bacterium]
MVRGMLAALMVGVICPIIGSYIILLGMSFFGDALAHTILPGVVLAFLFDWPLVIGALIFGILTPVIVGLLTQGGEVREDTAIGIVFAGSFALGVAMISTLDSYAVDLTHILFGDVLGVGRTDLIATFALGALVLLAGFGFVGLAGVSLVSNIVQVIWLFLLLRVTLFRPEWHWDGKLQRTMFLLSGPLMINHLLATIFWRIDVWILRPLAGAASVGLYSVGLKYLDGLNIIPSVFTMAVFPLMSRYARSDSDSLLRSYRVSVRLLVMVSLPIA